MARFGRNGWPASAGRYASSGRDEELRRLEELLYRGSSVSIDVSIEGLPGIGKTELALQFVRRLARRATFPGGVFC